MKTLTEQELDSIIEQIADHGEEPSGSNTDLNAPTTFTTTWVASQADIDRLRNIALDSYNLSLGIQQSNITLHNLAGTILPIQSAQEDFTRCTCSLCLGGSV